MEPADQPRPEPRSGGISKRGLNFASLGLVIGLAAGRRRKALKLLSELKRLSMHHHVDSNLFIEADAGLHDNEQTVAWLEQAYAERSVALPSMKVSPIFDSLRPDPRFQDLLRRVNIPQ